jgi:hypothetical protein
MTKDEPKPAFYNAHAPIAGFGQKWSLIGTTPKVRLQIRKWSFGTVLLNDG